MPTPVDKLPKLNKELLDKAIKGEWLEFTMPATVNGNKKSESPTLDELENNTHKTIQANFIRKVLLGLATDKPIVGVFIRGAIIKGKLDLRDGSAKGFALPPLRLDECLILGDYGTKKQKKDNGEDNPVIDARYANLKRLTLKRSRIGIIDLRGSKIDGNLDMDSVQPIDDNANACLNAEGATINGSINLRACKLRLKISEDIIHANLEYTDALCLYEAKINGSLMVYEKKIIDHETKKVTSYDCPRIDGRASLAYAEFNKNVWFYSTRIKGDKRDRTKNDSSDIAIAAYGLKCQVFRIEDRSSQDAHIEGHIELHYAKMWYLQLKNIKIDGYLTIYNASLETNVEVINSAFNAYADSKFDEKMYPHIDLRNVEINGDLKLEQINCPVVLANNAIVNGVATIKNFPPREFIQHNWIDDRNEYSSEYKNRLINFDNAEIGSDFNLEHCFVGSAKAKNIQVKGDAKFKDTFARLHLGLAVIGGKLEIDNEDETIRSSFFSDDHLQKRIIYSGIPKITANDLEVSGAVTLNELIINAEYDEDDANTELDFSGGRFKSEFNVKNITFKRTFKASRPVFSLDDSVIDSDLHFHKNKQVRKYIDDFCTCFLVKGEQSIDYDPEKLNIESLPSEEIHNLLFNIKELSAYADNYKNNKNLQRIPYLLQFKFETVFIFNLKSKKKSYLSLEGNEIFLEILNKFDEKLELPNSFQQRFKQYDKLNIALNDASKNNFDKSIPLYAEGWDLDKLNYETIKKYKIACYPDFEYVELISDHNAKTSKLKHTATTAFLIHQTHKNLSIHLDGNRQNIDNLKIDYGEDEHNRDENVKARALTYLKFFCAHVRGDYGARWIIDNENLLKDFLINQDCIVKLRELNKSKDSEESYIYDVKRDVDVNHVVEYVVDRDVVRRVDKIVSCFFKNIPVLYKNVISIATFKVDAQNGMVELLKDVTLDTIDEAFINLRNYKYADFREGVERFSPAKVIGLDVSNPIKMDFEYTKYALLHLMHVNFSLNSLMSNAFKFDLNGKKHNLGCGINLRMDGFEYKRIADNDEDLRTNEANLDNLNIDKDQVPLNPNSTKAANVDRKEKGNKSVPNNPFNVSSKGDSDSRNHRKIDYLSVDKYEHIEGVLDKQYDNYLAPTHNGFDSQPYEQMSRVLYKTGAYKAAKSIATLKIKHESLAQRWLKKTNLRNQLINSKANTTLLWFDSPQRISMEIFHIKLKIKDTWGKCKEVLANRLKNEDMQRYQQIHHFLDRKSNKLK